MRKFYKIIDYKINFSCYKIMFCMGVFDMLNLFVFCMGDGVLAMLGAVYCSAPVLLYMKGLLVMSNFHQFIQIFLSIKICTNLKLCGWPRPASKWFSPWIGVYHLWRHILKSACLVQSSKRQHTEHGFGWFHQCFGASTILFESHRQYFPVSRTWKNGIRIWAIKMKWRMMYSFCFLEQIRMNERANAFVIIQFPKWAKTKLLGPLSHLLIHLPLLCWEN